MTMRAYMSRTNHGQADCAMRPDCAGHPMDAMAEARAILAHAEPESRCPDAVTGRIALSALARSVRHPGLAFTLTHDMQMDMVQALEQFLAA
jgi:hypothetical protein